MIGVAADIYRGLANDSKYGREPQATKKEEEPKKKVIKVNGETKLLTKSGYLSISAIDKKMLQKMYESGFYKEAKEEMERVLGDGLSKSDQEILNNF